jgi:hypothetical protein
LCCVILFLIIISQMSYQIKKQCEQLIYKEFIQNHLTSNSTQKILTSNDRIQTTDWSSDKVAAVIACDIFRPRYWQ